jgi:glycosyltransferase involved in cell wall biosynthesis
MEPSLKVLQIISGREINGALTYCKFLTEMLASRGHEVTILCRENCWLEEVGVKGARFINSDMVRKPADVGRIVNWIKHEGIDVAHTHMSRAHAFGVILKMTSGIPVVATAHNRSFQVHWRMNDFVIANSQATMDYQRRVNRVPDSNIEKVHCFTDLNRFEWVTPKHVRRVKRQLRVGEDDFLCGCVGEVIKRKGQVYLFQALKRIVAEVPNFKLIMLGRFCREEPYTQKLRSILLKDNILGTVKWLGLRENVQDFMTAFDLLAVPSIEEPLGLVAVESLAAGTPVVATRTGGLPEIVKDKEWGMLVPPRNPEALAEAIIRLAKDAERRKQMGLAGKEFVQREFEMEALCDRVEQIYAHVQSGRLKNAG